jgi:hypothetical protein
MGQIAAQTLIDRIEGRSAYTPEIAIEPEFVVRQSTGPAAGKPLAKSVLMADAARGGENVASK